MRSNTRAAGAWTSKTTRPWPWGPWQGWDDDDDDGPRYSESVVGLGLGPLGGDQLWHLHIWNRKTQMPQTSPAPCIYLHRFSESMWTNMFRMPSLTISLIKKTTGKIRNDGVNYCIILYNCVSALCHCVICCPMQLIGTSRVWRCTCRPCFNFSLGSWDARGRDAISASVTSKSFKIFILPGFGNDSDHSDKEAVCFKSSLLGIRLFSSCEMWKI